MHSRERWGEVVAKRERPRSTQFEMREKKMSDEARNPKVQTRDSNGCEIFEM
jgi:hypothetical protein